MSCWSSKRSIGILFVLVSMLTATITTILTISELGGNVRGIEDLHRVRVGSVADSETLNGLVERGITVMPIATVGDGLLAIIDGRIEAFAFNEAILKYLVETQFPIMATRDGFRIMNRYLGGAR